MDCQTVKDAKQKAPHTAGLFCVCDKVRGGSLYQREAEVVGKDTA